MTNRIALHEVNAEKVSAMTAEKLTCLINESDCGRVAGNPVCPRCGMDERVVFPSAEDLKVAIEASMRLYRDFAESKANTSDGGSSSRMEIGDVQASLKRIDRQTNDELFQLGMAVVESRRVLRRRYNSNTISIVVFLILVLVFFMVSIGGDDRFVIFSLGVLVSSFYVSTRGWKPSWVVASMDDLYRELVSLPETDLSSVERDFLKLYSSLGASES